MGKVKKKPLPTPDTNPVDGDKLIEATKPKVKCDDKFKRLQEDIDKLGDWLVRVDQELTSLSTLTDRIANRMGLKE